MTDDSGDTVYVYNALSELTSEIRHFNRTLAGAPETGNGFKLQYMYTPTGQLASMTDPYGAEIDYDYDNLGRLTDVTGSTFGGVTTYAENARYRASDAPKAMDYGDTLSLAMTFNQRLQASTFKISKTGLTLIDKSYDYYLDGRLSMSHDLTDDRFDHKYSYGPVGEVSTVDSGIHARGGTGSRDDIPFDQTYGFDAFGHMNARDTWHWTESFSWSNSFTKNRGYGWDYDAEGRSTRVGSTTDNDELFTIYDANGNILQTTATENSRTDQEVDGDGRPVEQVKYLWNTGTNSFNTTPVSDTLFIRSSVLGGQTVSEAHGRAFSTTIDAGDKARTFVHAGGTIIAEQVQGYGSADDVFWHHSDASQTTLRVRNAAGGTTSQLEMDPMGGDAGTISPYTIPSPPDPNPGSSSLFPYQTGIAFLRPAFFHNGIPVSEDDFWQDALMAFESEFRLFEQYNRPKPPGFDPDLKDQPKFKRRWGPTPDWNAYITRRPVEPTKDPLKIAGVGFGKVPCDVQLPRDKDSLALVNTLAHEVGSGQEPEARGIASAIKNYATSQIGRKLNRSLQSGDIANIVKTDPHYIIDPINRPTWGPAEFYAYGESLVAAALQTDNDSFECKKLKALVRAATTSGPGVPSEYQHWIGIWGREKRYKPKKNQIVIGSSVITF